MHRYLFGIDWAIPRWISVCVSVAQSQYAMDSKRLRSLDQWTFSTSLINRLLHQPWSLCTQKSSNCICRSCEIYVLSAFKKHIVRHCRTMTISYFILTSHDVGATHIDAKYEWEAHRDAWMCAVHFAVCPLGLATATPASRGAQVSNKHWSPTWNVGVVSERVRIEYFKRRPRLERRSLWFSIRFFFSFVTSLHRFRLFRMFRLCVP